MEIQNYLGSTIHKAENVNNIRVNLKALSSETSEILIDKLDDKQISQSLLYVYKKDLIQFYINPNSGSTQSRNFKQTSLKTKSQIKTEKNVDSINKIIEQQQQNLGIEGKDKINIHVGLKGKVFKEQETNSELQRLIEHLDKTFESICQLRQDIDQASLDVLSIAEINISAKEIQNNNDDTKYDRFNDIPESYYWGKTSFQRKLFSWLLYREGASKWVPQKKINSFWREYSTQIHSSIFFNPFTGQISLEKESQTGGVLEEVSHYIEALTALILKNQKPQQEKGEKTTLIVTKKKDLQAWRDSLDKTGLAVYDLDKYIAQMDYSKYDVIITTHGVLEKVLKIETVFWKKNQQNQAETMYNFQFYRIILDQTSRIINYKKKRTEACLNLQSKKYKWCVTSEPLIQNTYNDLIPVLQFINQKQMPCANECFFNKYLIENNQTSDGNKSKIKQFVKNFLGELVFKSKGIVNNKKQQIHEIKLTAQEREAYQLLQPKNNQNKKQIQKQLKCVDYSQIHQIKLVPKEISQKKLDSLLPTRSNEEKDNFKTYVINKLTQQQCCQNCSVPNKKLQVCQNGHLICKKCQKQKKEDAFSFCHLCKSAALFIPIKYKFSEEWKNNYVRSSKIEKIREILSWIPDNEKCVIFTLFDEMVEVLHYDFTHTQNPITCYVIYFSIFSAAMEE